MRFVTAAAGVAAAAFLVTGGGLVAIAVASPPRSTPTRPSSAVDVGFSQDMAVHHGQALLMAQEALSRSRNADVVGLARTIVVAQAEEQGELRGWLVAWGAPQLPSGPPMTWMADAHMSGAMPGMATQAQLDRMSSLRGAAFDEMFLQLMVRHHEGGIAMATYAMQHAQEAYVRAAATEMVVQQTQEISVMSALLRKV
ncbi:MAG TPA: DUF305 domain-containing protein [Mycobacteriales bacterium]|nr:DUF305 domain-containing protein [Mycobacteriales bacterium]